MFGNISTPGTWALPTHPLPIPVAIGDTKCEGVEEAPFGRPATGRFPCSFYCLVYCDQYWQVHTAGTIFSEKNQIFCLQNPGNSVASLFLLATALSALKVKCSKDICR